MGKNNLEILEILEKSKSLWLKKPKRMKRKNVK